MVKILAALSILNSSGASPGATEKVAALVARATCSGASHSSAGVPQSSVLGPLLFLLYTSELFSILENNLIGYADHSTLMAVVPSPGVRVAVAESLIRYLGRVSEWCNLRGMKLNERKIKTMIISGSRTMHPQSPPLTIGGTVLHDGV